MSVRHVRTQEHDASLHDDLLVESVAPEAFLNPHPEKPECNSSRKRSDRSKERPTSAPLANPTSRLDIDTRVQRKGRFDRGNSHLQSSKSSSRLLSQRRKTPSSNTPGKRRFFPRLARVLEGKEAEVDRRRGSAAFSDSSNDQGVFSNHRIGPVDEHSGRLERFRYNGLQHHVDLVSGSLTNSSVLSVLSGLTTSSSGSNSTITQKSYDRSHISKRKRTKDRRSGRANAERRHIQSRRSMDYAAPPSNVFEYLQKSSGPSSINVDDFHADMSVSAETDSVIESEDGNDHVIGGLVRSPPPSYSAGPEHDLDKCHSDSGISMRGSSPEEHIGSYDRHRTNGMNNRHANHHSEDSSSEEEEEDDDEDEDEEDDEDAEENENKEDGANDESSHRSTALQHIRFSLPDEPPHHQSHSDDERLRQRIKEQEDDLRHHILQNPQPQRRDFRFLGAPSPQPQPLDPYYDAPAPYDLAPAPLYPPPHIHPQMAPHPASAAPAPLVPQFPHYPAPPHQVPAYAPHGRLDLTKTTVLGYELLANNLASHSVHADGSETGVKPLYRKFEALNHRVLLHLQDEISELEEELRYLDECIAQYSTMGDEIVPSRRAEARFGGDLHFQRTELLGRIYVKLGQYNQGLSSFNALNNIDRANQEDVEGYRRWIEQYSPVDNSELQFLTKADLVSVTKRRKDTKPTQLSADTGSQPAALAVAMITLFALFIFAFLPGVTGRLLVILLVGVAQVAVISLTELSEAMPHREWLMCGSIYFGFMAVIAALVR